MVVYCTPCMMHCIAEHRFELHASLQRLHVDLQTQTQVHNKLPLRVAAKEATPDIQDGETELERFVGDV